MGWEKSDAETNKAERSSADTEPRLWRNAGQARQVNITFQIVAHDCDRQVDGYLREHSTNNRLAAESESPQAE